MTGKSIRSDERDVVFGLALVVAIIVGVFLFMASHRSAAEEDRRPADPRAEP